MGRPRAVATVERCNRAHGSTAAPTNGPLLHLFARRPFIAFSAPCALTNTPLPSRPACWLRQNRMPSGPTIEVTPSSCTSGQRKQIENSVGVRWNYVAGVHAPCCVGFKPWSPQSKFCWGKSPEDAEETVARAVQHLQNIAPEGIYPARSQGRRREGWGAQT